MVKAVTSRQEMEALADNAGPFGGERIVKYNLFLTDAFGGISASLRFMDTPGAPNQIDGIANDDSYRASRHLIKRTDRRYRVTRDEDGEIDVVSTSSDAEFDHLRENSLARQIQEKEDRPATIRLIRRLGTAELKEKSSSEGVVPWENLIPPNTKFFLESVQENREEKVQIIDTFGEWVAFFFGRRPEIYSYSGTLLNAKNHDWKNEFQENYDHFLRGSQAVKNQASILMQYDDVLVEGYMLNCSIAMRGENDKSVPFQFNMLVTNRSPINARAIIGLRALRSGLIGAEKNLFASMQQALDLTHSNDPDDFETFMLMREYFSGNYLPGAGIMTSRPDAGVVEGGQSTVPGKTSGTNEFDEFIERPHKGFAPAISDELRGHGLVVPELAR